jgi:hypothetical protein
LVVLYLAVLCPHTLEAAILPEEDVGNRGHKSECSCPTLG